MKLYRNLCDPAIKKTCLNQACSTLDENRTQKKNIAKIFVRFSSEINLSIVCKETREKLKINKQKERLKNKTCSRQVAKRLIRILRLTGKVKACAIYVTDKTVTSMSRIDSH